MLSDAWPDEETVKDFINLRLDKINRMIGAQVPSVQAILKARLKSAIDEEELL